MKINIEASEWAILTDPHFPDIPARMVVVEYRRWLSPDDDPRRMAVDALTGTEYTVWGEGRAPGLRRAVGMRR